MESNLFVLRFFKLYAKYWQSDLEEALLEGRSFNIIDLFRVNLSLLLSNETDKNGLYTSLNALKKVIDTHGQYTNKISIKNLETNIRYTNGIDKLLNDEVLFYFVNFIQSYNIVSKALGIDHQNRKIQDLLVELNNALSHLIVTFLTLEDLKIEINRKRAISHLHRGILDSYKEIIHLNVAVMRGNTDVYSSLDNKCLFDYYIDLRQKEALGIGKEEFSKKELVRRYKNICNIILNVSMK